jgi:hypothetical protein
VARSLQQRTLSTIAPLGEGISMNNVIYIVGLVVVVIAVLTFFGLR